MSMARNVPLVIVAALLVLDILVRLGAPEAQAQTPGSRRMPIDLTVARTPNDNYLLYRLWSDGSIDVKLSNPIRDQLTFQEGWRKYQLGP